MKELLHSPWKKMAILHIDITIFISKRMQDLTRFGSEMHVYRWYHVQFGPQTGLAPVFQKGLNVITNFYIYMKNMIIILCKKNLHI